MLYRMFGCKCAVNPICDCIHGRQKCLSYVHAKAELTALLARSHGVPVGESVTMEGEGEEGEGERDGEGEEGEGEVEGEGSRPHL